jgi:hypothetical protein
MFRMRQTAHTIAAILCTIAFAAAAAPANIVAPTQGGVRGATGTGLTTSAPGTAFSFDYRALVISDTAPYEPASFSLTFDAAHVQYSELKIQLDSSPTPFTFLPVTANGYQSNYVLYDPAYELTPGSPWPATPAYLAMPQAWRDDLTDGVLSGKFWVTNPAGTPNTYFFSTNAAFVVPEPTAGLAVIATAAAASLLRCRRRRA